MTTTALAKPQTALPKTVKSWLTSDWFKTQVALCLPKHLTPDRFCRTALTALTRVPKLADCTPETVIKAMMTCSELGIEPDGRRAHLIPFRNNRLNVTECQLIIDYKGLVELAKRSGDVSGITAQIVCERDNFQWNTGEITHVINFKEQRGNMYAAYCVIKFKDGSSQVDVMTKAEIDSIRRRSRAADSGPWVTDYNEMAKKTVFRRASKWITLSPEVADALEKDADNAPIQASTVVEAPISIENVDSDPGPTITPQAPDQSSPEAPPEASNGQETGITEPVQPETAKKRGRPPKQSTPQAEPEAAKADNSSQDKLADAVISSGFSFDDYRAWLVEKFWDKEVAAQYRVEDWIGFESVPEQVAKLHVRSLAGLIQGLKEMKQP
jgi:recombination protein RecT